LGDIPDEYISFNNDGSVTFKCKDKPNEGPNNLIFDMKLSEKEIFESIDSGFQVNGEKNGIKRIFSQTGLQFNKFLTKKRNRLVDLRYFSN